MKEKMVGILVCTLMFASAFSGASIVKSKVALDDNNQENYQTNMFVDTFLYPPWADHDGWVNTWSELAGYSDGNYSGDGYKGHIDIYAAAVGLGKARTDAYYYHQTQYTAPRSGYYDFVLTYDYYGTLDGYVWIYPASSAELVTDITVSCWIYIDQLAPGNSFDDELILDQHTYYQDVHLSWDDTFEFKFNDIKIEEGNTIVYFGARIDAYEYAAAGLAAGAGGTANLDGSLTKIKIVEPEPPNQPPTAPSTPSGPTSGKVGQPYTYSTSSTDPDGDSISYYWDWGDGTNSGWTGSSVSHTWTENGAYSITVKAKDEHGAESKDWSDSLSVSMPKTKFYLNPLFTQLLEWFYNRILIH